MTRNKDQIIRAILRQDFYTWDNSLYQMAYDGMERMSIDSLRALELIVTMRVVESNSLVRQVDKILADNEPEKPRRGADLVSGFDCLG